MKPLQWTCLALISLLPYGCELSQPTPQASERPFAPRLLDVPTCNKVRIEIAEMSFLGGGFTPNPNMFNVKYEANYSDRSFQVNALPTDRTLHFRISGLDATGTVVWDVAGQVPNDVTAQVAVGNNTSYKPNSLAEPTFQASSDPYYPTLQCPNGTWPAWTLNGQTPTSNNSILSGNMSSQTPVRISAAQTLWARCTNGFTWSQITSTYVPAGPNSNPGPIGWSNNFVAPAIGVGTQTTGIINFTADTASYAPNYSHWKIVYDFNNSNNPIVGDLRTTKPSYSGSGTISAYLMAWGPSGWVAGQQSSTNYPKSITTPTTPGFRSEGTFLSGAGIQILPQAPWTVSFSNPAPYDPTVSEWKVFYKYGSMTNYSWADMSTTLPMTGTGIISAYLMAWSTTVGDWVTGPINTKSYSTGASTPPMRDPSAVLPNPAIQINTGYPFSATLTTNLSSDPNYSSWKIFFRFLNTSAYMMTDLNSGISLTGSGTIYAYLMAWSNSAGDWVTGSVTSRTFCTGPTLADAQGPGRDLDSIPLTAPLSPLPSTVSFSSPTPTANYTNWNIAYWTSETNIWQFTTLESAGVMVNTPGTMKAYLMAWDPIGASWHFGPQSTISYPATLAAPQFKDAMGNLLGPSLEADGINVSLRLDVSAGTIYYTRDQTQPFPGNASTYVWTAASGIGLDFPLSVDSLVLKAISFKNNLSSPVAQLVVRRPGWLVASTVDMGCLGSVDSLVVACGDAQGPRIWDEASSRWIPITTAWTGGQVTQLSLTDNSLLLVTARNEIWIWDPQVTDFSSLGTAGTGTIGGIAEHFGNYWISTSSGPMYYDNTIWSWVNWPYAGSGPQPNLSGPLYSDGQSMWMGSGSDLWRYGSSATGMSDWSQWANAGSTINTIGPDPYVTNGTNPVLGSKSGIRQINTNSPGLNVLPSNTPPVTGVMAMASAGGALYAAFDDNMGNGGIYRSGGWSVAWGFSSRNWPASPRNLPAQAIVSYSDTQGTQWLMASTHSGSYRIKVR